MDYNYQQICQDLIRGLPARTKDVISRRFGLKKENRETLQLIGDSYKITRERVRQVEVDGFRKMKPALKDYQEVFDYFHSYIKDWGDLKKEDKLLSELGGEKFKNQVYFLMAIEDRFLRHPETEDLYTLWAVEKNSLVFAKKILNSLVGKMRKIKSPLSQEELFNIVKKENSNLTEKAFSSYIDISKLICQGLENCLGLPDWPEINPRGIKDKAYLVLKKQEKPLHFREVASLIDELNEIKGMALPQTVHNELIKDERFVLVGRGLYALKEWGYEPGVVKDIILKVLKKNKKPLRNEEIVKQVLSQRLVKPSTVLANLQDRNSFVRDNQGRYRVKKA